MPAVKMQDGTEVEFGERAKVIKRSEITADGHVLVKFLFKDGTIRTALMPNDHDLLLRAAQHGLDQKFGDAFAGIDDVEDMILAFDATAEQVIEKGDWTEKRIGDGLAGTSVLARALVEVTQKDIETVKAKLKTLTAAQKTALRTQPGPVADAVRRIEAEREARRAARGEQAKVDVAATLAVFN